MSRKNPSGQASESDDIVTAEDDGGTESSSTAAFAIPDAEWFRSETMPDETVVIAVHPSVVISMPSYVFGSIIALAGIVLGVSYATGYLQNAVGSQVPMAVLGFAVVLCLGGVAFAGWEHLTRTNTWYLVTDKQALRKTGVFNANTDPIDFSSITEIEADRPFWLRPFGIGHVRVFAASTGGADLYFPSCPDVNVMVNSLKKQKRQYSGDGTKVD